MKPLDLKNFVIEIPFLISGVVPYIKGKLFPIVLSTKVWYFKN